MKISKVRCLYHVPDCKHLLIIFHLSRYKIDLVIKKMKVIVNVYTD